MKCKLKVYKCVFFYIPLLLEFIVYSNFASFIYLLVIFVLQSKYIYLPGHFYYLFGFMYLLNIFNYYHNFLVVFFLALLLQVIDLVKNNKPICFTFLITDNLILVLF